MQDGTERAEAACALRWSRLFSMSSQSIRYKDGKVVVRDRHVTSKWAKNSGGLASVALDSQADLIHA
jgi:hypothetical protein